MYFWVLLGTYWSFWVFFATFVDPSVKKKCGPPYFYVHTPQYFLVLLGTLGYLWVILSSDTPCEKNLCPPLLLCMFEYFLVLVGTLEYWWVILSIFLHFWVLLGTFFLVILSILATSVVPLVKKNLWSPLLSCTFEYFFGSFGYFRVLMSNFGYCSVRLSTFGYFFGHFEYFWLPLWSPCEKKPVVPLYFYVLLSTFWYFRVLMSNFE